MGNLERETRIGTALPEKVPSSCRTESIGESHAVQQERKRAGELIWLDVCYPPRQSESIRSFIFAGTQACVGAKAGKNCDILYTKVVHPIELTERPTRALPETAQFLVPALPGAFARAAHMANHARFWKSR
jgi:hypothetical protein